MGNLSTPSAIQQRSYSPVSHRACVASFELPYVVASTPAVLYVPWGIVVDLLSIITTPSIWRIMLPTGQRVAAWAALTMQVLS